MLVVVFAARSYTNGREAIRRAIQATTKLGSSDAVPAAGVGGAGLGQGRGGGGRGEWAGEKAASGTAVPLLHASQVRELARSVGRVYCVLFSVK